MIKNIFEMYFFNFFEGALCNNFMELINICWLAFMKAHLNGKVNEKGLEVYFFKKNEIGC